VEALRNQLEATQAKLADFQRDNTFVNGDDRVDVENARLAEISEQLVTAQANTYDANTKVKQMNDIGNRGRLQELPDILGNPLLQNMKADLVRAEGKFAQVSKRYDHNHPEYISAAAELNMLRSRLGAEINVTRGSINQAAEMAQQREKELQDALDRQKGRILEMKKERNRYDVLARNVENAQRAYDTAVQRAEQVHLESKLDQSGISILNPAIPPMKASKPRLLLNSILAFFVGSVLGVGFALVAELRDRRLRSNVDITGELGVPVLAELPLFAKTVNPQRALLIDQR
jgi:polysaccharide biosynthesis transport protein